MLKDIHHLLSVKRNLATHLLKRFLIFASFILMLSVSGTALGQDREKVTYVDYDELIGKVLSNLKAEQSKTYFLSSAELKAQTQGMPPDAKAKVNFPARPGKKILTSAQIFKASADGVLMICKYYKPTKEGNEKVKLYATATALSEDGVCVSNWHVFMNFIRPKGELETADSLTFVVNLNGDIFPVESVLSYSQDADIALFKINSGNKHLHAIPLGDELNIGETVHTITNPENYLYYYSKGVVARNTTDHKIGPMSNRMEITADYAKGSSGGPILDDKGNLAGMVSSTYSIYAQDRPQINLQMVVKTTIPVGSIRRLIQF